MQTSLGHIQLVAKSDNLGWYKDLFTFLGWSSLYEDANTVGMGLPSGTSVWVSAAEKSTANDYDAPGLNHIGIGAESIADVDATAEHLKSLGIAALFETPRHRPEFSADENSTYYQVMFESPDRILFEVVYTGPK